MLYKYDRLIARNTWKIQLQMGFAFSFEMWQLLCGNARFAIAFGLRHNLCAHMWKTQLKIQFAIPFENSQEDPSIHDSLLLMVSQLSCNGLIH